MTYEQIAKANETIKTIDIKGKEYATVNQRIKAFRMLYPEGFIHTTMLSNEDGVCYFLAEAGYYNDKGERVVLGTGHAFEKETSSYINRTSYIENCESSSIGRCLGLLGFGIDTSVASAEEVQNAVDQQEDEIAVEKKKIFVCGTCGELIPEFTDTKGKVWTPKMMSRWTSEHAEDRVPRCKTCYDKYMEMERKKHEIAEANIRAKYYSKEQTDAVQD